MNKTNLKDEKRGAFYKKDGRFYVSVTEVLKVLDKPALRYWFGQQVYYAMLKNPNLTEKEALASPYEVNRTALNRGTTVHSIIEAYKHSREQLDVVEEFRGYAQAFYKWIDSNGVEIIDQEKTVFHDKMGYAGTLDLFVTVRGEHLPMVVDVKTGKDIYQEAFLQTSAYAEAVKAENDGQEVAGIGVLLLDKDGGYKYQVVKDIEKKFRGFTNCLEIWQTINEEMIKKLSD